MVSDINASICMGGRPLAHHIKELQEHNVHSVINVTCECAGPHRQYQDSGIVQLQLSTLDLTPPSFEDLQKGVAFAQSRVKECGGGRVYVHCKGGRGRSAVLVLCCLMAMDGMEPEAAFELMASRRPVVEKAVLSYECLKAFAAYVTDGKGPQT
eukprot:gnl/TRDRNA2_/TRDRNA2_131534_c0_seq1.p1 gnl/TRDRNA2_/TRDRNA2_131534_c0~~gnl/TRDRNA2_/TRDRNA2_131534_c0_seq1.p1  ORF type:complete len:170 (-),score=32.22 gnl/TRDRNA2_/TRDRNA2_131534_c0_seq1:534-995(-)